nr:hypothetical protein [Bacteroides intestinalis]
MRRSRRQREEENEMIQAIKYWQRSATKAMLFIGIPLSLLYVGFAWWVGTPAGEEFTGWTEVERHAEKRLESLDENAEKRYNEFTESTNEDVQNTIDDIQGTEDTTGTEQYSEEVQNTINELEQ